MTTLFRHFIRVGEIKGRSTFVTSPSKWQFSSARSVSENTRLHYPPRRPNNQVKSFQKSSLLSSKSSIPTRNQISKSHATMAIGTNPTSNGVVIVADDLEKPLLDKRSYRIIRLPNQLEALIVHDPETDKASAALDVNVGSFSDPKDMPGLAHAVEHMLFMGTEKYPQENDYNEFLAAHNGYSNAYTSSTSTNYYFEVSASDGPESSSANKSDSGFFGALDRFAQFFIHPLFLEDTLDREIQSVDSENKKNLQSDPWRLHQLQQSLANPNHPFCHFSTGNWSTLHEIPLKRGQNLRNEFMGFYQQHYSANRMKLVVLGLESLETLQEWVIKLFSPIEDKNLPMLRWDGIPIFNKDQLAHQIFAKPVLDSRYLDVWFPFPNDEDLFESQPAGYLSHLIGHEGPGSLLSYLKEKGWANELSAGNDEVCHGDNYFAIQIRLTEEGLKGYQDVLEALFQYVAMMNTHQPANWIFEEQKSMAEVNFRFRQTAKASKTTSYISGVMQHAKYPRNRILSAAYVTKKFDAEAIAAAQASLRPDNCRFILVSQNFPGTWKNKEKWYGTEYTFEQIPADLQARLEKAYKSTDTTRPAELHLPHRNEFIPTRFDVEKKEGIEPAKFPKLIRNDQFVRTWHQKDDRFWVPKASLNICLRTPLAYITPRCAVMAQFYCGLVQDSLNEYAYDADIAGLSYSLSSDTMGLEIAVVGYNDKMPLLVEKLLNHMKDFELKENRFKIYKERYARSYKNWGFKQPFNQAGHYKASLHSDRFWTTDHYAAELDSIGLEDVRTYIPQLLQQLHIEILAYGNLYKEDALQLTDLCERILRPYGLPLSQWPARRSLIIPTGSNLIYARPLPDPANVNHCVEVVVWAGSNHDRTLRGKAMMIAQIADEPCYDQLRTKEQLGYVVFSGVTINLHRIGFRVLVQSEKSPEYLEGRIESFLEGFGRQIDDLDDSKFEKHRASLISRLKEKTKNMREECDRLWSNINSEYFDFDAPDADSAAIQKLTKKDILEFYETFVTPKSEFRAKVSIHLVAQGQDHARRMSPEDKRAALEKGITSICEEEDIPVTEALHERIQQLDPNTASPEDVAILVQKYLLEDAELEEDEVEEAMEAGKPMFPSVLVSAGMSKPVEPAPIEVISRIKPVTIADVVEWKSKLQPTSSSVSMAPISNFEDLESKL